jgi:ATP-binding cassette subfamily B multidrug efflux pump
MNKRVNTDRKKSLDLAVLYRILSYLKPYKQNFAWALFTTILLAGISPVRPWLVQYTIDHSIAKSDFQLLVILTFCMIGLLMLETLLQFADSYLSTWLGQKVIKDIRVQVFSSITNFKLAYFDKNAVGTLVTRAVSDTEAIADIFSQGLLTIIGDLLKLTVLLFVMFFTDWRLALVSISTVPILIIATVWFKNAVKKSFQDVRNQVAKLNAFVQEHLSGMQLVQIFNREQEELKKFSEINLDHTKANIRSIWHYSVFFPIVEILSSISLGLLVWFGAEQVMENKISIGHLIAFIMYINMMFRPIRMLADRFNTLQMGMVSSERVFKIIDTNENISDKGNLTTKFKGDIEFKDVWFAYEKDNWVLKNLSFKVRSGQKIALVGATGSGKTSITSLINRFYEYQSGTVFIDDVKIEDFDLSHLRNSIGIVLQDVFLFSDTIMNNITLGDSSILETRVIEAAKLIGIHNFIMQLPGNYNYNVMERGATLSVGQRQLLAFLRVYVHNPSILILDEATSSIDSESEELIQRAMEILTLNRTAIIVAHRLSTIKSVDQILVLDKGVLIEKGTHLELIQRGGAYFNLVEKQFNSPRVLE